MAGARSVAAVITWTMLFGLYALLVGQATLDEMIAAGATATLATVLSVAVRRISGRDFRYRRIGWFTMLRGPLIAVPRDTATVAVHVLRRHPAAGTVLRQPSARSIANRGPRAAAYRGVVTLATSLAPNTFVISVLQPQRQLLVHRLVPQSNA